LKSAILEFLKFIIKEKGLTGFMSLITIWRSNQEDFQKKRLQQIIAIAGEGKLGDGNRTCEEFREFLCIIPSDMLTCYANECLEASFENSGFALQDVVNEIGSRLGFEIERGLYRGRRGEIGCDGLWALDNSHRIVVEVKTTDAYAINLDTIAKYRKELIRKGKAEEEKTSLLLVVGRKDTGGLEAQIRGSRYAWDMRVISVDALVRLMRLKENLDDPAMIEKISDILIPQEFTRLDRIVDIVFSTAEEAAVTQDDDIAENGNANDEAEISEDKSAKPRPLAFHKDCVRRVEESLGANFIRESRSIYIDKEKNRKLWVAVSKQHGNEERDVFWFAFHPHHSKSLESHENSLILLGCGSPSILFLIPYKHMAKYLDDLWKTIRDDKMYWHIKIEGRQNRYFLLLKRGVENPEITEYLLSNPQ
jgi:hypothetical protein